MVEFIRNEEKYWDFIRTLRNLNRGFVEKVDISPEQQAEYMKLHNDEYYVLIDDEPVGFVGVVEGDIRIAVSPQHQGKGYGRIMLEYLDDYFEPHELNAKVLIDNDASNSLFLSCGYTIVYSNDKFNHYKLI